ncbi:MAG: hypothetical protein KGH57_00330 [Candidatus Micrarchaeota archaeon]|nr:hypothetical protein [Candidatus Micrarchaeota archaeon]
MTNNRKFVKAQSAMEYLMTYGWAILIIAVVLGALFSLGVFSSGSLLGTSCIAYSGYECQSPILHGGQFSATIGQSTGSGWTAVNIILVGYGTANPAAAQFAFVNCYPSQTGLSISSGSAVTFSTYNSVSGSTPACTLLPTTVGTAFAGGIWAFYTSGGTAGLISQLATLNVKAT